MSKRGGYSWPWSPAFLWVLALCFCLSTVLPVRASEPCELTPSALLQSIERRLQTILEASQKLEAELTASQTSLIESERHVSELQSELSGLRLELESSADSYGALEKQAGALVSTMIELQLRLQALSQSYELSEGLWSAAVTEAEKVVRRRSLERWLWAGMALAVGAAVGFGIAQAIP